MQTGDAKLADSCVMACFTLKKWQICRRTALLLDLIMIILLPNFSGYFLMHRMWGFLCGKRC